eukprot:TRINITY_DN707_c0_g4_i1.p1 TRINITY_DN707_c0_g4~~TRINITY_DN707_c0_g4_i1.p1  ORF type:complete len:602 (+),score=185.00 TRINITY_DN707_c0_g4_i1:126-1931(+)
MAGDACPHKRHPVECGRCPRRDVRPGDAVAAADDGTGARVTWFDGEVVSQNDDGCVVVRTEVFGEGVWDRVKAKVPRAAAAAPAAAAVDAPQPSPASVIPLAVEFAVGLRVRVKDRRTVEGEFAKHRWTVSEEVRACCGRLGTIVETDKWDDSIKVHFPTEGEAGPVSPARRSVAPMKNQWWPAAAIEAASVEAEAHKQRLSAHVAGAAAAAAPQQQPVSETLTPLPAAPVCALPACTRPAVSRCTGCSTPDQPVYLCGDAACYDSAHPVLKTHRVEPLAPSTAAAAAAPAAAQPQDSEKESATTARLSQQYGADVEDALAAANAAVHAFTAPSAATVAADGSVAPPPAFTQECGHGVKKVECGRCPRTDDLSIGDRVVVGDKHAGDSWFQGVVEGFHETGYPLVNVELFEGDGAVRWDKVKAAPPPPKLKCPHGKEDASLCGRCPHAEVPLYEQVEVSVDGVRWQKGVVASKTAHGTLEIALAAGMSGFTWEYVRAPLRRAAGVVPPPSPAQKKPCPHAQDPAVCGFCHRHDLPPGRHVKVAMGTAADAATFDGAVVECTPAGTIVRTELLGDMRWDRVWVDAPERRKVHYDATVALQNT